MCIVLVKMDKSVKMTQNASPHWVTSDISLLLLYIYTSLKWL